MSAISWKTVKNYTDIRFEKCDEGIAKITIARPEAVSYTHLTLPTTPYV